MGRELTAKQLQQEAMDFRSRFKTILLATTNAEGIADASYSPCTTDESGSICIFVSELAQHTKNLFANLHASLMFIADESDSRNLFARKRLVLSADAEALPRENSDWVDIMARMKDAHGGTIDLLASLPDFHLFRFKVREGTYVRGFGQAFSILNDQLEIDPERRTR